MKNQFIKKTSAKKRRGLFASFLLFSFVCLAFWSGISSVSKRMEQEEQKALEKAVIRGIISCYAIEGTYPASLDFLKENYGLVYNEDKYFIDYQPLGANIMPDVTILKKR